MLVLKDNFNNKFDYETYIALGSFDGLHLGHLKLIDKSIEISHRKNAKSMVFTFRNHPLTIINNEIAPKLIMGNDTKIEILDKLGVDIVNMVTFDKNFMELSPEDFISKIVSHYKARGFIVGFNYRFGYKNLGDVDFLVELGKKQNFEVHIVEPVSFNGEAISSSRIRNMLSDSGNIEAANMMLSRPFMLKGNIIYGKQLGRKLGFPTINLDYDKRFILPRGGVYYTNVLYNHKLYKSITNIGYNPTVKNTKLGVETHIIDFNKNIYGECVKIYFLSRIRDEKRFYSLEDLTHQLEIDKKYAEMKNVEINL